MPAPDWIALGLDRAFPQDSYIAVEGRGKTKKAAEADALAALSRYFETRIETTMRISETSIVENNRENYRGVFENGVFEQSAAKLFALRYAPHYYNKTEKEYSTVAYIDREEARLILEPHIKNEAEAFRALLRSAENETEILKIYFAYKAADNFSKRPEFVQTMNFARMIFPSRMNLIIRDVDAAIAELNAKINAARNVVNIFIDINNDYESNIKNIITKLFSAEGLNISENKKTAEAFCKVIVDENIQQNESGTFYYPKITITLSGKSEQTLFSYQASTDKVGALDANVAKRRAYNALAAEIESNFLAKLNKEFDVQ